MTNTIHTFEQAGLGKAPFKYIGSEIKKYQAHRDAPVQPAGTCDYCGNSIMECCWIEDAEGKKFIVGNECVRKTGDKGITDLAQRDLNKRRLEARHEREAVKIAQLKAWLEDERITHVLSLTPHPWAVSARQGLTALDYATWILKNAGNKGKLGVYKLVEQASDGTLQVDAEQVAQIEAGRTRKAQEEAERQQKVAQRLAEANKAQEELLAGVQGKLIQILGQQNQTDFIVSITAQLQRVPLSRLSPRQKEILGDIYGRWFGRRNSGDYTIAVEDFEKVAEIKLISN